MARITHRLVFAATCLVMHAFLAGCKTTPEQISKWEREGNTTKLSEVTRSKAETPEIRRKSLESLARLNWKPSNEERLQVFSLFASPEGQQEATALMQTVSAEQFAEIDAKVVSCASLLTPAGTWTDMQAGRAQYDGLRSLDGKAVKISLCQQVLAHPEMQTRLVLLAIKLGIAGSENELVGVLMEYGNKSMAEDYLNSGSGELRSGAIKWANARGYRVRSGRGSHRAGWGKF